MSPLGAISSPILVSGASGFVGAAVVRRLRARGRLVRVLVRPGARRDNIPQGVEVAEGDLTDPASLKRACQGIGGLFHVAADYRLWVPDPAPMFAANVAGSLAILRAAAEAGAVRLVHTSSVAVLKAFADGRVADEETPVTAAEMIGPYKLSKFRAEEGVRELAEGEGLPVVIVNPSTPVGPGDIRPTPTGRVILDAARGRMPAFVDTGLNVAHVDDVAEGHLLAFEKGQVGRRYILGGDDLPLKDILARAAAAAGRPAPRVRLPVGAVVPVAVAAEAWARLTGKAPLATLDELRMARKRMYFSSARAEAELGYVHRPATVAIDDAVAWFAARGALKTGKP
ncbi:hopanoid-associated sugar epimerase [Roseospirillum parvum]|uniref:Dihydroflavonol-4-reductase n=1 Tax=Roseospirillum parvum TaxID=83401 RepID=A0A1G7V6Q0_9PROT|nr:hopanoid-associated sugar epimerase [Roseospirillum parvum]SDG55039.1 dihydroflavonol-4-reductase [Roseospirillum parvum]